VPLLEVVTEPDMRSGVEAAAYGAELRRIVTFLDISNGNMQVWFFAKHNRPVSHPFGCNFAPVGRKGGGCST